MFWLIILTKLNCLVIYLDVFVVFCSNLLYFEHLCTISVIYSMKAILIFYILCVLSLLNASHLDQEFFKSKAPDGMGAVIAMPCPFSVLPVVYLSIDAAHNSKGITQPDRFISEHEDTDLSLKPSQIALKAPKIKNRCNLSDNAIRDRLNAFYKRLALTTDLSEEEIQNRVIEYKNYIEHL